MKKRVFGLLLAVLLLTEGSVLAVRAEDYAGDEGWQVVFTGDRMESSFQSSELSDAASALQPGDQITFQIALKNEDSQSTDWYMSNEVLSSLEDSQRVAQGGSYTYILTYHNAAGEENVLYSSENVGGERKVYPLEEGLHEATDSLDQFFYLDTLKEQQSGLITLKVCLDGETQGNAYQDTLAKLQMNFAVEKGGVRNGNRDPKKNTQESDESEPDNAENNQSDEGKIYTNFKVRTGDEASLFTWSLIALCSGLGLAFFVIFLPKKKTGGREDE